jgi:uncharacterized protein (TIGR02186 family)
VKRVVAIAAFMAAVSAATAARAEKLTVAISTPQVQITSNFTGVTVTTFGVIEGADPSSVETGYQVAVVVLGPPQSVIERRKDRVLGVWANRAAETVIGAPSFYALDASGPLDTLAPAPTLARLGLGFDNLGLVFANDDNSPAAHAEFQQAFIRLQSQVGLFTQGMGVQFIGDDIFRSATFLPANIPEGKYTVLAYLFSGQSLVAAGQSSFAVSKIGFEQTVASFATGQSMIYGLLTVALSIFVGWLGGVIFRRD